MATTQQPQADFVKAILTLDATALVVGSMIGSGIFIVSAEIAPPSPMPPVLLVGLGGVGHRHPHGRDHLRRARSMSARGRAVTCTARRHLAAVATCIGWTLFVVIQTGISRPSRSRSRGSRASSGPASRPTCSRGSHGTSRNRSATSRSGLSPQRILAVLSVALLTWINVRGVRTAAADKTSLTAIKTGCAGVADPASASTIAANARRCADNLRRRYF